MEGKVGWERGEWRERWDGRRGNGASGQWLLSFLESGSLQLWTLFLQNVHVFL